MNRADVGNDGERITPDQSVWSFYAHLSIYKFAAPFVDGKRILDAGCGTGYGSVYLSRHNPVSVVGCDASAAAIHFCQERYATSSVTFEVRDLCQPLPYHDGSFDLIFSSNAMEHLADIDVFLDECRRTSTRTGSLIAAVPPITSALALEKNLENTFHVTNLTPLGWMTKLQRFFTQVDCHLHRATGKWSEHAENMAEVYRQPDQVTIRETDFEFPLTDIDTLNREHGNITAVFVARQPRPVVLPRSTLEHDLPYEWHVGTIIANLLKQRDNAMSQRSADTALRSAHPNVRGTISCHAGAKWKARLKDVARRINILR